MKLSRSPVLVPELKGLNGELLIRSAHSELVACSDEQYRFLWAELESLTDTFRSNSEFHRKLAEVVAQATSHAPSMQLTRKTGQGGGEESQRLWPPSDQ